MLEYAIRFKLRGRDFLIFLLIPAFFITLILVNQLNCCVKSVPLERTLRVSAVILYFFSGKIISIIYVANTKGGDSAFRYFWRHRLDTLSRRERICLTILEIFPFLSLVAIKFF